MEKDDLRSLAIAAKARSNERARASGFVFLAISGTFSTTETEGRLGCNHRMSLECLVIRWHKS